jgi:hypothetical protein
MVNRIRKGPYSYLSPGVLTVVLPIVSGIAAYAWSAWIGSMTGTPCDESRPGVLAGVTLIVIYLAPAIVVAHAAILDRKSRLAIVALTVAAAVLTFVAVSIAALFWAGGHNCLG